MTDTAFTDTRRFKVMRTVMGAANPFITAILGSRFAGPMAKALLLLRFTGRTSGTVYTTPVGYVREGDSVVVVTSPTYTWWKNIRDGADVQVLAGGRWYAGHARIVPPRDPMYDEVADVLVLDVMRQEL